LSDDNATEAKDRAKTARTQAKHASKNIGRSARAAGKAGAEEVADAAENVADRAEEIADEAVQAARRVNVGVLGKMSSDTGVGFLALSVCIYSGTVAYVKFRQAASGRSQIIS
jgi:F0F1-type ATP synthase membrane subunit b/b'